jgi:hypothetical protein
MPGMGRTGTAAWEEKNKSDDAATTTVLKNVSEGFRPSSDSIIYCVDCSVEAITGSTSR